MEVSEFVDKHKIKVKSIKINRNPNMDDDNKWKADHYEVTLTIDRADPPYANQPNRVAKLTTYFSKGTGHLEEPPTAAEVLDALIMDSDAAETNFEDWADSIGFDPDSRKAEKIYETCRKQAKELMNFLGMQAFLELKKCERL